MSMILPSSIDLRSGIDNTYYQGGNNKCFAFSSKGAIETCLDRSTTHAGVRVSADYIYARGKFWGSGGGGDIGLQPPWVQRAVEVDGVSLNWNDYGNLWTQPSETDIQNARNFKPVKLVAIPFYNDDIILSIKRSLAFGLPVIIVVNLCTAFYNIYPQSWKTMNWDANDLTRAEHALVIVGYDDSCNRFLVENSWGSHNGDGGYYGFPYDKFLSGPQFCVTSYWRFENLPVKPIKVPGFTAGAPVLTTSEASDFFQRYKPHLTSYLNTLSGQTLVDECIRLGVSDKMLESLKGWTRGSMAQNLPGCNFTGMHYDSTSGYWFITSQECLEFVGRNKQSAFETLAGIMTNQGIVALMQTAKTLGYSEKHVEYLAGWERGLVRDTAPLYGIPDSDIIFDLL